MIKLYICDLYKVPNMYNIRYIKTTQLYTKLHKCIRRIIKHKNYIIYSGKYEDKVKIRDIGDFYYIRNNLSEITIKIIN